MTCKRWMAWCLCAALTTSAAVRAADPVVESVLADWKTRQSKVKTARYELSGQSERLDVSPAKPNPVKMMILFDLEHKRIRIEKTSHLVISTDTTRKSDRLDPNKVTFEEQKSATAYDGKFLYSYYPRNTKTPPSNPNLSVSKGNFASSGYQPEIWPILEGHGIVPLAGKGARPDKLPLDHDPDTLYGRGEANHAGRKCNLISGTPPNEAVPLNDELYVDRERVGAIARHVNYANKKPWIQFDIGYADGHAGWMPAKWVYLQYGPDGKVREKVTMTVDQAEFNVPVSDRDFSIEPKPGDVVMENEIPPTGRGLRQTPARTISQINEKGEREVTSQVGFTTTSGVVLPPERATWYYWLLSVPVIGVLIGGVALWRRSARKRSEA